MKYLVSAIICALTIGCAVEPRDHEHAVDRAIDYAKGAGLTVNMVSCRAASVALHNIAVNGDYTFTCTVLVDGDVGKLVLTCDKYGCSQ